MTHNQLSVILSNTKGKSNTKGNSLKKLANVLTFSRWMEPTSILTIYIQTYLILTLLKHIYFEILAYNNLALIMAQWIHNSLSTHPRFKTFADGCTMIIFSACSGMGSDSVLSPFYSRVPLNGINNFYKAGVDFVLLQTLLLFIFKRWSETC